MRRLAVLALVALLAAPRPASAYESIDALLDALNEAAGEQDRFESFSRALRPDVLGQQMAGERIAEVGRQVADFFAGTPAEFDALAVTRTENGAKIAGILWEGDRSLFMGLIVHNRGGDWQVVHLTFNSDASSIVPYF